MHEQDSFVDMRKFPLIVLRTLQRYEGDSPIGNNSLLRGEPNEPENLLHTGGGGRGEIRQTNRSGFVMLYILYRPQKNSNQIGSGFPIETCD